MVIILFQFKNKEIKDLFQWSKDIVLKFDQIYAGEEAHFSNNKTNSLNKKIDVNGEVTIPNILLTESMPIEVYLFIKEGPEQYTKKKKILPVIARPKPEDYIYTEEESKIWDNKVDIFQGEENSRKILSTDENGKVVTKISTDEIITNKDIPLPTSADNGKYLGCENGAAAWMSVEASGGGDISLGLTAASVGQTIKVKAVDENGKPTEWEAAKEKTLKWIKVHSSTLTEEATSFSVSADENGKPITDYNPLGIAVALYIPADSTQADNNGPLWVYPQSKNGDAAIRVLGTISGWKTINRDAIWMWQGGDILGFTGNNNGAVPVYRVSDYVMDGVYVSVHGNGNHLPVGTKALVTILCEV